VLNTWNERFQNLDKGKRQTLKNGETRETTKRNDQKRNKTKSKRKKEKQKNVDDLEMLNNDDSEEEQSFKAEEPHSVVQHELQESSKKLPRTLVPIVSPPLRKLGGFVDDEKKKKSKPNT
jgi:hypothetical protein